MMENLLCRNRNIAHIMSTINRRSLRSLNEGIERKSMTRADFTILISIRNRVCAHHRNETEESFFSLSFRVVIVRFPLDR